VYIKNFNCILISIFVFEKQYQYFQIYKIFSNVEKDIYAELVTYFQSCKIYAERETNLNPV